MNHKLFSKLNESMEQFIENISKTEEYDKLNFWTPEDLALHMANAAAAVFDATVESSHFTKEQEAENK